MTHRKKPKPKRKAVRAKRMRTLYATGQEIAWNLEQRIARIEAWIDQWENYDSGWNKYRARKGKRK